MCENFKELDLYGVQEQTKIRKSPLQSPVRASCLLMTISISLAPSATASLISSRRVFNGVWPAGKPVATVNII